MGALPLDAGAGAAVALGGSSVLAFSGIGRLREP